MSDQKLSQAIEEALKMRAQVGPAGFEAVVRQVWPFTREWKYLCERCGDYGLEMFDCPGDATCGRPKEHLAHDYGIPCWCDAGRKFRAKPRTVDDDITSAAAKPKPKPFTRFGR